MSRPGWPALVSEVVGIKGEYHHVQKDLRFLGECVCYIFVFSCLDAFRIPLCLRPLRRLSFLRRQSWDLASALPFITDHIGHIAYAL